MKFDSLVLTTFTDKKNPILSFAGKPEVFTGLDGVISQLFGKQTKELLASLDDYTLCFKREPTAIIPATAQDDEWPEWAMKTQRTAHTY